jgi:hypothetical protein
MQEEARWLRPARRLCLAFPAVSSPCGPLSLDPTRPRGICLPTTRISGKQPYWGLSFRHIPVPSAARRPHARRSPRHSAPARRHDAAPQGKALATHVEAAHCPHPGVLMPWAASGPGRWDSGRASGRARVGVGSGSPPTHREPRPAPNALEDAFRSGALVRNDLNVHLVF